MSVLGKDLAYLGIGFESGGTSVMGTVIHWNPRLVTRLQSIINNLADGGGGKARAAADTLYTVELPAGVWPVGELDAVTGTYALYLKPFVSIKGKINTVLKSPDNAVALSLVLKPADCIVGTNALTIDTLQAGGTAGIIIDICNSYVPAGTTKPVKIDIVNFKGETAANPARINIRGFATGNNTMTVKDCITCGNNSVIFTNAVFNNFKPEGTTPTFLASAAAQTQTLVFTNSYLKDTLVWTVSESLVKMSGCYVGRVTDIETAECILRTGVGATGTLMIEGGPLIGNEDPNTVAPYGRFREGSLYYCTSTHSLYAKVTAVGINTWTAVGGGSCPIPPITIWDPATEQLQALMDRLWLSETPSAIAPVTIGVPPGTFDVDLNGAALHGTANLYMYPYINLVGCGGKDAVTRFITGAACTVDHVTCLYKTGTVATPADAGAYATSIQGIEILRATTSIISAQAPGVNLTLNYRECFLSGSATFQGDANNTMTVNTESCRLDPTAGNHIYTYATMNHTGADIDNITGNFVQAMLRGCIIRNLAVWTEATPLGTIYNIYSTDIGVDGVNRSCICPITGIGIVINTFNSPLRSLSHPHNDCAIAGGRSYVFNYGTEWFATSIVDMPIPRPYTKLSASGDAKDLWASPGRLVEWYPAHGVSADVGISLQSTIDAIVAAVPSTLHRWTIVCPPGRFGLSNSIVTLYPYIDLVGNNTEFYFDNSDGATYGAFVYDHGSLQDVVGSPGEILTKISGITFDDTLIDGAPALVGTVGYGFKADGVDLTQSRLIIFKDCVIRCPFQCVSDVDTHGLGLSIGFEGCVVAMDVLRGNALGHVAWPHFNNMGLAMMNCIIPAYVKENSTVLTELILQDCDFEIIGGSWSDNSYIHTTAATVRGTITVAPNYLGVWTNLANIPGQATRLTPAGAVGPSTLAPNAPVIGDSVLWPLIGIPVNVSRPSYAAGGDVEVKCTIRNLYFPWNMHGANKYRVGTLCAVDSTLNTYRKNTVRVNGPGPAEIITSNHRWLPVTHTVNTVCICDRFIGPYAVDVPGSRDLHVPIFAPAGSQPTFDNVIGGAVSCVLDSGAPADETGIYGGDTFWLRSDLDPLMQVRITPTPVGATYEHDADSNNVCYIGLVSTAPTSALQADQSFAMFRLEKVGVNGNNHIWIISRDTAGAIVETDLGGAPNVYTKGLPCDLAIDMSNPDDIRFFVHNLDVTGAAGLHHISAPATVGLQPLVYLFVPAAQGTAAVDGITVNKIELAMN